MPSERTDDPPPPTLEYARPMPAVEPTDPSPWYVDFFLLGAMPSASVVLLALVFVWLAAGSGPISFAAQTIPQALTSMICVIACTNLRRRPLFAAGLMLGALLPWAPFI